MNLINLVQNTNWAIIPEKLDAINQVLHRHMIGDKIDLAPFEDKLQAANLRSAGDRAGLDLYYGRVEQGVAILSLEGILAKRMNLMMLFSGGTSMELAANDFRQALASDEVKAILLEIDSPGGTVDGTEALADLIYGARGIKPIVAFVNGLAASAAYWIASSADKILIEETGEAGSIGVVQIHYDYSRADEKAGVRRSLIYAGKYKTIGNNLEPLTREARDVLQEGVDYMYSIFVNTVARNRNVAVQQVLDDMADGRLFIGRQAVEAGLVDDLGNLESAFETALALAPTPQTYNRKPGITAPQQTKEGKNMLINRKPTTATASAPEITLEYLQQNHPDLVEEIEAAGAAGVDLEEHAAMAAKRERERILGLCAIQFGPEQGDKFKKIVSSGLSVEQFQAVREADPPREEKSAKMDEMLQAIQEAGPDNPGAGQTTTTTKDFMTRVNDYALANKVSKTAAMKALMKEDPKAHEAWVLSKQRTMH